MPHSLMTIKELIRAAQDQDDCLVKALAKALDEITEEISILANSEKGLSEIDIKHNLKSDYDSQFEYVKRLVGLKNNY